MAITVQIELDRAFSVSSDIDTVFTLLADVPKSASHFPKVEKLTPLGDNSFRWEMKKIGIGDHAIQTCYACKYLPDAKSKVIEWTPIQGEGNSVVAGKWTMEKKGTGTLITLYTTAEMTLPLPGLLKLALSPIVKMEFASMVDTYIENLTTTLGE
jgi:carbon monoxide dehydrogenase subunit G